MPASRQPDSTEVAPLGDRRGLLALDVGDAEAAADRQLGEAELAHERRHDLDGLVEEVGDEHLAADVHVDADELDAGCVLRPGDGARRRRPTATPKPNFESFWPVRTNSWVWASTPGRDPEQHLGHEPVVGVERGEAVELVEAVDDDPADAGRAGRPQLVGRLVVAVEHEPVGGHAGGERDVELAAGGHVEVHALLVGEAGHGQAQERLGGVGDAVAEGGDRLAAAGPQVGLVVDEQRRAEALGQVEQVAAADRQPAVGADRGGVGQQVSAAASRRVIARRPTSTPGRTRRAGRGRWRGRCGPPRRATGGPG